MLWQLSVKDQHRLHISFVFWNNLRSLMLKVEKVEIKIKRTSAWLSARRSVHWAENFRYRRTRRRYIACTKFLLAKNMKISRGCEKTSLTKLTNYAYNTSCVKSKILYCLWMFWLYIRFRRSLNLEHLYCTFIWDRS